MNFPLNVLAGTLLMFSIVEIICAIYSAFHSFRLLSYLKDKKYFRWEELTSIGRFGPGLNNAFRIMPYVYNAVDNDDEKIAEYKASIRSGTRYLILTLIAFLVNFSVLWKFVVPKQ